MESIQIHSQPLHGVHYVLEHMSTSHIECSIYTRWWLLVDRALIQCQYTENHASTLEMRRPVVESTNSLLLSAEMRWSVSLFTNFEFRAVRSVNVNDPETRLFVLTFPSERFREDKVNRGGTHQVMNWTVCEPIFFFFFLSHIIADWAKKSSNNDLVSLYILIFFLASSLFCSTICYEPGTLWENLIKVQPEFSFKSTTKKTLKDNHYKTIYESVRSECSSCRVYMSHQ